MAYRIEQVCDDDFAYIVPNLFLAMGREYEFVNALYPNHWTVEGQRDIVNRFLFAKNSSSNAKWIKAVAPAISQEKAPEIVGVALWTVIDKDKPPEKDLDGPPGTWPNETEKEYCQELHRSFLADRRRLIRENELPIITLNIMAVFPDHQRKGAGSLLLNWGIRLADELNALCTVEGTLAAKKLYEKGGFVVEHAFDLDAGEKFANRPKDRVLFMARSRSRLT